VYSEDRIYLRLGLLIDDIISSLNDNIEAYAYVNTIRKSISNDSIKSKKTEKFILSPGFINQKVFTEKNRNIIIPILRDYKILILEFFTQ
jgi:hypothetical protein